MKMSYKKLWKLLIDKEIKRTDLRKMAGISSSSLAKLGKDENVTTAVLLKICSALDCNLDDIAEVVIDDNKKDGVTEKEAPQKAQPVKAKKTKKNKEERLMYRF